jgi:hypothetical protein
LQQAYLLLKLLEVEGRKGNAIGTYLQKLMRANKFRFQPTVIAQWLEVYHA